MKEAILHGVAAGELVEKLSELWAEQRERLRDVGVV